MKNFNYDLTIGLIVKNEEKTLRRCLDSLMPLKKELDIQLIITDTGSTDKTKEIAKEYTNEIIDFVWCDDFSKARNTGTKLSKGKWFMFIDADEYFDESVLEIASFLKSNDSKNADSGVITRRDYTKNMQTYDDFSLTRLFNFSNGVREFDGIIHENIIVTPNVFKINCLLHHDGYLNEKKGEKILRNNAYLIKAINENPYDFRTHTQIIIAEKDFNKRFEYAQNMLNYASEDKIKNDIYIKIALCEKAKSLYELKKYNELIDFYNFHISEFNKNSQSYLEMLYFYLHSQKEIKNYQKTNIAIIEFQKYYKLLEKNPDNIYPILKPSTINYEKEYYNSFILLSQNYLVLADKEKSEETLKSVDITVYNKSDKYDLFEKFLVEIVKIEKYDLVYSFYNSVRENKENRIITINIIENIISSILSKKNGIISSLAKNIDGYTSLAFLRKEEFDIKILTNEILSNILNDELLYENECFIDALYFDIKNKSDNFKFIKNYKKKNLDLFLEKLSNTNSNFKILAYDYLVSTDFSKITSLKEVYYYKNLAYYALISKFSSDKDLNITLFELFLSLNNEYNSIVYKNDIGFNDILLINEKDAVAYILFDLYINKNNINELISALKLAISIDENLIDISKIIMAEIETEIQKLNSNQNEFSALGNQIKAQIKALINQNKKNEALMILQQYEKINPNDIDIKDLYIILKS